jgi:uncharacterized membrane protein YukC
LIAEQYKTASGHDWTSIWMIPAGISALIWVAFLLFFKDPSKENTTTNS